MAKVWKAMPKGRRRRRSMTTGRRAKGPSMAKVWKAMPKGRRRRRSMTTGRRAKGPSMAKAMPKGRRRRSMTTGRRAKAKAMASMAKGMTTKIVATSMAMIGMRAREIPQARAETIGNIWIIELE